jgi:predicted transcriptional regulator
MANEIPSPEEISSDIRSLRSACGLSQQELATVCGLSQSTIARLERDISALNPSYATVFRVMEALRSCNAKPGSDHLEKKSKSIMHKRIVYAKPYEKISHTIEKFKHYDFPQLPVLDNNLRVIGTVYQRDLLGILSQNPEAAKRRQILSIMKGPLPQITKDMPVSLLRPLLESSGAVIIVENGKAIGIITIYDIIKGV